MREFKPFDENFSLAGRVALVTGAGAGIGEAIALMFARKGADIIAVDINADAAGAVVDKVKGYGKKGLALAADITDNAKIAEVVEKSVKELGKIDILVNCAGVALLEDAEKISADFWNRTINLNLSASFFMSQAVGNRMIKQGGGKIINMASQAAVIALDRHVAYNSSKAGIVAMTQVLACEWAEFDIQVNAISPTVILTELGKKAWAGEVGEAMKKKIPAGRFGYPEEVAAMAVYLASDAANLVTGANFVIDGGYTIQ
ncbi:MAG: D-threitol dehydrogenase [Planctomycetota bacterium]|jgi:NAD(P)-dependent dehydrogenase (short-subunit alcohol dehydrogenase family)|nr:D-threitol dehydrogenase [Planctomycetota bacterium]